MKDKHKLMFMRIAEAVALTSSATRLKVGAVIVKNNRVISTGYNALPVHIDGECETLKYMGDDGGGWLDWQDIEAYWPYEDCHGRRYNLVTKPEVRHGEKNAILNLAKSTESSEGSTLFCTHACCHLCSVDIVDAGIVRVYYKHDYRDSSGINYLKKNGVEVIRLEE